MPHIISTVNVNGVRAAAGKGLLAWLAVTEADIVCLQETRATDEQVAAALAPAIEQGWQLSHAEPGAKGRAGVGVLSRRAHAVDVHCRDDVGHPTTVQCT
ncbi:endonuclease/exonuclease/phosphatase family protein, partial [Nocardia cyriacigeorgica]|uniref:endonuclease/exonuclease/phosphatase family protein n=1 Tax=Nocardia cyriacigeorgica TaxID=135487 RepID=UPI00158D983B